MTRSDDFHVEMNLFGRHDHEEEERLLRGESPAGDPELFLRLREAKRVLTEAPRAPVAAAHMAAIAEEAHLLASRPHGNPAHAPDAGRTRQVVSGRVVRKVRRAAVSVVVAAAGVMGSVAGLAYAGVSLPSPALTAFHKLGITLPDNRGGGQPGLSVPTPGPSNHGQVVRVVAVGPADGSHAAARSRLGHRGVRPEIRR